MLVVVERNRRYVALATYWVWVIAFQAPTYSLVPGRDNETIAVLYNNRRHQTLIDPPSDPLG